VISGVFLLVERPIKAGDWVSVNGHEGFVRRINIRATESRPSSARTSWCPTASSCRPRW